MKPEEAVNQIEELMTINNTALVYLPDFRDAFELAIEALKEMPVEGYRQRLMEVFHKTDHDELLTYVVMPKEEEFKSLEDILRQYKYEPRPHGEWIFTGRHNVYGGAEIECSNCHNKLMVSPSRWEIGENFCDVCGSRNKKEGEKNESTY